MRDNRQDDADSEDVVGIKIHTAAITKFLWSLLGALAAAFVFAAFQFAWHVNSNCVEFRQSLAEIRADDNQIADHVKRMQAELDELPPASDLAGIRLDVSQLQYTTISNTQAINEVTRNIRDLHPWSVQQRGQDPPAPAK